VNVAGSGLHGYANLCWTFEFRVRPTHYTIKGDLKSWVVESSLDGVNWIEIDRKTDNEDLNERRNILTRTNTHHLASFAVANSTECRFIRVAQTAKNHIGNDRLTIRAFEVFGTLIE
jgi:hypothetical protein